MMQEHGSSLTRLCQSMQLGRLSKCGDIWKWWVHCRTRCPIHCKGLLLARGQLASSGRRLWAGQVPFPGENISRLGKGEHWAWQALQGITRIPLPNQPVLRLARSIQMRSTENGPRTHLHIHCRNWKHLQVFQYVSSQGLVFLISKSEREAHFVLLTRVIESES